MSSTRALMVKISNALIEDLLKKYVINMPQDLKIDSVEDSWVEQNVTIYFRSEKFPVADNKFKENVVAGRIVVAKFDDGRLVATLHWKDPNKKIFKCSKCGAIYEGKLRDTGGRCMVIGCNSILEEYKNE